MGFGAWAVCIGASVVVETLVVCLVMGWPPFRDRPTTNSRSEPSDD